jgi:hypothetical protein
MNGTKSKAPAMGLAIAAASQAKVSIPSMRVRTIQKWSLRYERKPGAGRKTAASSPAPRWRSGGSLGTRSHRSIRTHRLR